MIDQYRLSGLRTKLFNDNNLKSLRDLCYIIKYSNIGIWKFKKERRDKDAVKVFKEIIVENCSSLKKTCKFNELQAAQTQ